MEENKKVKKTENMKEYRKQYREQNKDKIKTYYKNWLDKNNNNCEKVKCCCGSMTVKSSLSKHRQTNKHQEYEKEELKKLLTLEEEKTTLNNQLQD